MSIFGVLKKFGGRAKKLKQSGSFGNIKYLQGSKKLQLKLCELFEPLILARRRIKSIKPAKLRLLYVETDKKCDRKL